MYRIPNNQLDNFSKVLYKLLFFLQKYRKV